MADVVKHLWGGEDMPAHIENIKPWVNEVEDYVSDTLQDAMLKIIAKVYGRNPEELNFEEGEYASVCAEELKEKVIEGLRQNGVPIWNPTSDNYDF